ncbi:hypothetical protein ACSQ67_011052 [Phaseolus vulgaris]
MLRTSLQNLKNHSLSRSHRENLTKPNSSAVSLSVASSGHRALPPKQPLNRLNQSLTDTTVPLYILFSTSAGIRQLGSDQPLTGALLRFQFLPCLPPPSFLFSIPVCLLFISMHALILLKTARKIRVFTLGEAAVSRGGPQWKIYFGQGNCK